MRSDQELVKVFEHLKDLVLSEVAITSAQINDKVGQLALRTEEIRQSLLVREGPHIESSCISLKL